jgi:hypothetical protein
MGVSNLAELRRSLRQSSDSRGSERGDSLVSVVRDARGRIEADLNQSGRSEVRDSQGNRFLIERKKA